MTRSVQMALGAWRGIVVLFGGALTGAGFASTDEFARLALSLLGHPDPTFTPEVRFAIALMGAVTLGWGLTIAAVVSVGDRLPMPVVRTLWRRVTASVLAWFVIDSALSIATGFPLNAVSNLVLLAIFLAIMWRGRLLG